MRSLITATFVGALLGVTPCFGGSAAPATVAEAGGATELNLVHHRPAAAPLNATDEHQLIVKFRDRATAQTQTGRVEALAARRGFELDGQRSVTARMQVLQMRSAAGETVEQMLARLRADPDVEYAVVDQRRYVQALTPNDPLYSGQWFLQAVSAAAPAAIDATNAWSTTTGSSSVVIADIDTGVRPDHPDLTSKLVPGYCFISDTFEANNATCPGPDESDPGDWVTSSDISNHPNECGGGSPGYSSWHGTRVAGILGAASNNAVGVAGVSWDAQVLPVRALGKCGGTDSDIITAMLWAAGIQVTVNHQNLVNPNPARIINLSLGGSGACPASYQDAINQILAKGVVVVASAGNETGAVDVPANCPGVIAVGGLREDGTKVGYSSFGPEVTVSAPAGNCVNSGSQDPCLYTVSTTTNLGVAGPDANDYTGQYYCYPDATGGPTSGSGSYPNCTIGAGQYRTYNVGTSFSAPQVAGIAALMTSVNANLSPSQVAARIKAGATAFPQMSIDTSPQPPACPSINANGQCICTNDSQTCGAGMANAAVAVDQALRPIAAIALPSASFAAGANVAVQGGGSAASSGAVISSHAWTNVGSLALAIANADMANATVTSPACGVGTVELTVTDDADRQDTADVVITPTSASTTAPSTAGPTNPAPATPAVIVAVCPTTATFQAGSPAQTFNAYLANTANTNVTWKVNGVVGGNANVGTVSASGQYTPPANVGKSTNVNLTAVSVADTTVSSTARVTITPIPGQSSGGGGGGGGAADGFTLIVIGLLAALTTARRLGDRRRSLDRL
ncbi:MAG TPA: S8 family serine peptidase [Pseudomonadales bacterium]|nr:S8 family serine peptidase [Pseudomonadales bacterium]